MRIIEVCSCRASLEVIWSEPDGQYDSKGKRESKEAKEQMAVFHANHKNCLKAVAHEVRA